MRPGFVESPLGKATQIFSFIYDFNFNIKGVGPVCVGGKFK